MWGVLAAGFARPALAQNASAPPRPGSDRLSAAVVVSVLEDRLTAGAGVERTSGPATGVLVTLRFAQRWRATARLVGGSLGSDTAAVPDRDLGEIGALVGARVLSWLELQGDLSQRVYSTDLAVQQWRIVALGAEAHVPFLGGHAWGTARGALLPIVSVNGLAQPDRAFRAGAGVGYRIGPLNLSLDYLLERYDFPPSPAMQRLEQLSGVTLGVEWRPHGGP